MRVAVICEFSGIVRNAFSKLGHYSVSYDLLPSETDGNHVQGDVTKFPLEYWSIYDLVVCHPPCTHLAVSGARWFKEKQIEQIIQPWMFGHGETKSTCLWLKNLPLLIPTNIVDGRENRIHKMPPSPNRWKERSRTFLGIAEAMANQWGGINNG